MSLSGEGHREKERETLKLCAQHGPGLDLVTPRLRPELNSSHFTESPGCLNSIPF